MKTISGCILVALLASTSVAMADDIAIVSKVGGKNVTMQSADGSGVPRVQTLLSAGDTLAAGKGSAIEIRYLADNCRVRVEAGNSAVIGAASPCAASASAAPKASDKSSSVEIVPAAAAGAEVKDKDGPVTRVNMGEGLKDAAVGDALEAGDEAYTGPNSTITLYFPASQCTYTVPPSTVYRVTDAAPCKAAAGLGAAGAAAGAIPTGVVAGVGAVVIGVGAVAVIASESSGDNNPATPD